MILSRDSRVCKLAALFMEQIILDLKSNGFKCFKDFLDNEFFIDLDVPWEERESEKFLTITLRSIIPRPKFDCIQLFESSAMETPIQGYAQMLISFPLSLSYDNMIQQIIKFIQDWQWNNF